MGAPDWVTLIVRVVPPPLIVIVAVREDVEGLAAAVTVTEPLFIPEEGETVSHVAEPRLTVQFMLDVTSNVCCSLLFEKFIEARDMDNDGVNPDCVTLMVYV